MMKIDNFLKKIYKSLVVVLLTLSLNQIAHAEMVNNSLALTSLVLRPIAHSQMGNESLICNNEPTHQKKLQCLNNLQAKIDRKEKIITICASLLAIIVVLVGISIMFYLFIKLK